MPKEVAQGMHPTGVAGPGPGLETVTSLGDQRALQILGSQYSSLLAARSLAYNEAFTRGAMFLAFLSMSFVALALLAQALPIDRDFLVIVAIVLGFDLVVGLTTYGRVIGANYEDYRAVHGMARIRHGYGEVAPIVLPFLAEGTHDDLEGVMVSYGSPPTRGLAVLVYQLTTSASMVALIVSMVGGVLMLVVALSAGASVAAGAGVGAVTAIGVLVGLFALTIRFYLRVQSRLEVLFPTPSAGRSATADPEGGVPTA